MTTQLENFKVQLEKLKAKGVDIDTEQIVNEIKNPVIKEKEESNFNKDNFDLARKKIDKLLDDFYSFYGPKGRSLKVQLYIGKENSADNFSEKFVYEDNKLEVIQIVEIGTKGKYEPVDYVGEK